MKKSIKLMVIALTGVSAFSTVAMAEGLENQAGQANLNKDMVYIKSAFSVPRFWYQSTASGHASLSMPIPANQGATSLKVSLAGIENAHIFYREKGVRQDVCVFSGWNKGVIQYNHTYICSFSSSANSASTTNQIYILHK